MRHYRVRRDANHSEIVTALKALGACVLDLASIGGGCPDVLTWHNGRYMLLEIKNPARKTRGDNSAKTLEKQLKFRAQWKGEVVVVDSVNSAIAAVCR